MRNLKFVPLKCNTLRVWATIFAVLLCLGAMVACSSNDEGIYGRYRYEETIYANPLSSWYTTKENAPEFTITEKSLSILYTDGTEDLIMASFEKSEVDAEAFADLFMPGFSTPGFSVIPDISAFKQRHEYSINERYSLYVFDNETWLAFSQGGSMWGIYQIIKEKI